MAGSVCSTSHYWARALWWWPPGIATIGESAVTYRGPMRGALRGDTGAALGLGSGRSLLNGEDAQEAGRREAGGWGLRARAGGQ